MPITSPSYFPPSRGNGSVVGITAGQNSTGANNFLGGQSAGANSTIANLIVIGANSGNAGLVDNANLQGSIIIGVGSGDTFTAGNGNLKPVTIVGSNNLKGHSGPIDSTVSIGSTILSGGTSIGAISQCVLVGNNLFPTSRDNQGGAAFNIQSIIIGDTINSSPNVATQNSVALQSIMIGSQLFTLGFSQQYTSCIYIGNQITSVNNNASLVTNSMVVIGNNIGLSPQPSGNVLIGTNITYGSGGATTESSNVIIGTSISYSGNQNTAIGAGALVPVLAANASFGNVMLGAKAGADFPATINNLLGIGAPIGAGAASYLLYGSFASGNLILGNSVQGTNRDFGGAPGTNILKLLNGTKSTGANIIGGGYFYVSAGILHWVDSAGNDIDFNGALATGASTASFVATNKPGATTGAGPVQWLNVVVNGTSYQQPLWAT